MFLLKKDAFISYFPPNVIRLLYFVFCEVKNCPCLDQCLDPCLTVQRYLILDPVPRDATKQKSTVGKLLPFKEVNVNFIFLSSGQIGFDISFNSVWLTLSLLKVTQDKSQILFCKKLKYKWYRVKVLLKRFHSHLISVSSEDFIHRLRS